MLYGLKRRWFGHDTGQIKKWVVLNQESTLAKFSCISNEDSSFGRGYSVVLSLDAGKSMADILYDFYDRPENMIYINRINTGQVWFVFASNGVLYSDYLISPEKLAQEYSQPIRNELDQEFSRYNYLSPSSEVVVICNDVTSNDNKLIFFANEDSKEDKSLRLEFKAKFITKSSVLPEMEQITRSVSINKYDLIDINKIRYPVNAKLLKRIIGGAGVLLALVGFQSINMEDNVEVIDLASLPPIVTDTFKPLKDILSGQQALDDNNRNYQEGVAIKQRFIYIIQDLILIRKLKGWRLSKYQAGRDFSSFTLEKTYGDIESVKEMFPSSVFYIQSTLGGFTIARNVHVFPIFNVPVRANYNKEMVWLGNAINWVWPETKIINAEPIKVDANQKHIESTSTVKFNKFYIEDFDSLSSLFVGRSAGFDAFEIEEIPDRKAYKGFLNYKIYGVRGEFDGMVK